MDNRPVIYEPHPVSPERKAELVAQGFRIIDAIYAPADQRPAVSAPVPVVQPAVDGLTAGKGPGGRWYVKRGKEIVTGPFETQEAAEAAIAGEAGE